MQTQIPGPIACPKCSRPLRFSLKIRRHIRCVYCQQKRWYETNKDRILSDLKQHYEENAEEIKRIARLRHVAWRDSLPADERKKHVRAFTLWRKYRIRPEEYERMFKEQDGKCYLCSAPPPPGRPLCVDHCHRTKKIRHLLCSKCNFFLGHIEANGVDLVNRALTYLNGS